MLGARLSNSVGIVAIVAVIERIEFWLFCKSPFNCVYKQSANWNARRRNFRRLESFNSVSLCFVFSLQFIILRRLRSAQFKSNSANSFRVALIRRATNKAKLAALSFCQNSASRTQSRGTCLQRKVLPSCKLSWLARTTSCQSRQASNQWLMTRAPKHCLWSFVGARALQTKPRQPTIAQFVSKVRLLLRRTFYTALFTLHFWRRTKAAARALSLRKLPSHERRHAQVSAKQTANARANCTCKTQVCNSLANCELRERFSKVSQIGCSFVCCKALRNSQPPKQAPN